MFMQYTPLLEAGDSGMIQSTNSKVTKMKDTATQLPREEGSSGFFNYLDDSARPSLYRNGEVLTRRDPDGSDGDSKGISLEEREMTVHNARRMMAGERRTVETNGFEMLTRPLGRRDLDFFDQEQVVREYYGECAQIVGEVTGAHAFAFDHNIRSATGKKSQQRISGGQQVQGPAHLAHGDYTLFSGPQRLRDLAQPPSGNDTLRSVLDAGQSLISPAMAEQALAHGGRFSIINLWRNIANEPVAAHPVALCDAQSVHPEDLVVFEIHYQDRVGENYFAKHSPRHQWYYYPGMSGDEALLIKQWDSAGKLARSLGAEGDATDNQAPCTFSFHSAFEDPSTPPDAPDRWSIEVRCIVLYD